MTNFGTMRYKHIISVVLWSMFLVACGPDRRVALAEKLMAEKETDSAIAVMQEIKEPQNNLTDRDYALYALLLSEAMHRKQQLNAETDTLLLPAIKYFSESGDSLYAERALYCKAHLDRRLYRMKDAMQSFLKALLFLQGSGNDEQLYRVNTWLGVVCLNQEEYEGKMRYSKEALKAALRMDNLFYKNLALCDIATGYYFLNRLDSALYYAQAAYDAAIADSLPSQLPHVYTDLGSIYAKMGENGKALEYIDKAIGLRPRKDTLAILGLYADKVDLFGKLGQYDSAYHYFRKAVASPNLATQADAYNHMSGAYYKMGRCNEAYSLLLRFTELADSVRKQRHTAEVIALQELYKHEQLSVENLYWRTQAAERQSQCISDGYLVPIVAVDSKYHLFLLLAQPPPAGGAAAPACQSAGRIASSAASDYRELAAYGRNGAEGSPAEGDFLQKAEPAYRSGDREGEQYPSFGR